MNRYPVSVLVVSLLLLAAACGRTGPRRDRPEPADLVDVREDVPRADVYEPRCGDGIRHISLGEECDWGDDNDDLLPDHCRTDCTRARCGDGVNDSDEECDDGNMDPDDGCSPRCQIDLNEPCLPCEVDAQCFGDDVCTALIDGSFCALNCTRTARCPVGYFCGPQTPTLDLCLPDLGVCTSCYDFDGDGYGVGRECLGPDCDDDDIAVNPEAIEVCDGVDNDCDTRIDGADAQDAGEWFQDSDGDTFGNPLVSVFACDQPEGFVRDSTDCDDTNAIVNPGEDEICDDIDNNCNGGNDEGCPPDLIVDAETIAMSGEFLFDRVEILNGGRIDVIPFDGEPGLPETGTDGAGCLSIEARIVFIREDSGISASGAGGAGLGSGPDAGFGPGLENTGPGGGGYGGRGGSGPDLVGGATYGSFDDDEIRQGSRGGNFDVNDAFGAGCDELLGMTSVGGAGGGCIELRAHTIEVLGYLRADGHRGQDAPVDSGTPHIVDGGAGGSGGGILLVTTHLAFERVGQVTADGGRGGIGGTYRPDENEGCIGNGGGGGGGGRIKFLGDDNDLGRRPSADGGLGAEGPQANGSNGQTGTIFIE
jgi:cysteine-rich repeat protein